MPLPRTIATICARGGSKGLPGKNIRDFAGKPLIVHSIEQAQACPEIDAVYVSTDDEAIAAVVRAAGATVPYLRPAELASDSAPKLPVIEHLVRFLERQGQAVVRVVDLQPTSPLRDAADISAALRAHPEADLVVSVKDAADNPYFNLVERGDGWLGPPEQRTGQHPPPGGTGGVRLERLHLCLAACGAGSCGDPRPLERSHRPVCHAALEIRRYRRSGGL
jgi:CMP-N-acetylneuraminic acid synthetase